MMPCAKQREIKTGLISTDAWRKNSENLRCWWSGCPCICLKQKYQWKFQFCKISSWGIDSQNTTSIKIRLIDSLNASLAQGLLAIYAKVSCVAVRRWSRRFYRTLVGKMGLSLLSEILNTFPHRTSRESIATIRIFSKSSLFSERKQRWLYCNFIKMSRGRQVQTWISLNPIWFVIIL